MAGTSPNILWLCTGQQRWDDAGRRDVRSALLKRLFDATMLATDPGQPRVGHY